MSEKEVLEIQLKESNFYCEQKLLVLEVERVVLEKKLENFGQLQRECEELKLKLDLVLDSEKEKFSNFEKFQFYIEDFGKFVGKYQLELQEGKDNIKILELQCSNF